MYPDTVSPIPEPRYQSAVFKHATAAPRIISCKMTRLHFTATSPNGRRSLYVLNPEGMRARKLPTEALIYVRIDPAAPEQVEVFEPSTVYHKFLGLAQLVPGLPEDAG